MGPASKWWVASNVTSIVSSIALRGHTTGACRQRLRAYPRTGESPGCGSTAGPWRTQFDVNLVRAPTKPGAGTRTSLELKYEDPRCAACSCREPSAQPRPLRTGPRADRQDAPRYRGRVGARLRLSDRRLPSHARPVSPDPDGHHREQAHSSSNGDDHGQRHHSGRPPLAVSPNPTLQLPLPCSNTAARNK
jgi:hypothetical protein